MFSRNFTAKGKEKNWESWCLCKAVWVSVGFGSRTCQIMVAFYKMSEYSQFSSVQSLSHVRLCDLKDGCISGLPPCLSPTPGVYSSSCPSSRWCHPIISSSVIPVSSCLQSFPASGSFQLSQFRWPKFMMVITSNYKVTNLARFKSRIVFLICTVLPVLRRRPTPVLLPGKSHGQSNLVGCSPWGCKEWDTTERLHFQFSL